ncbi:hypothetical protein F0562_000773 [Nyssa sinensis]|uniref:BZIP domain-containing protein n=1 Tax=Nyssa sinensis TaxID=561372 RepID=A0A5J5C1H4_9ASTE|nr:hypothetical protein F0562_000773 [Nyssa sinensis]
MLCCHHVVRTPAIAPTATPPIKEADLKNNIKKYIEPVKSHLLSAIKTPFEAFGNLLSSKLWLYRLRISIPIQIYFKKPRNPLDIIGERIGTMASMQQQTSSGSDGDPRYAMVDERKRKRMLSNRESARRSRMKKQQLMDDLLSQVNQLQNENNAISQRIDVATQMYIGVASDNNVLRARLIELADRLHSLNSVLLIAEEVSGVAVDIPELPDTLLEPWQLPCPIQPITASADMFQY